jgi:hypothetical protein
MSAHTRRRGLTRLRHPISSVASALASVATAVTLLLSPIPGLQGAPAASAQLLEGPGYLIPHATRVSMVGAFLAPDGSLAYCLEWGQESPTLASDPPHSSSVVSSYSDWGSSEISKVNWLISTHGQTVDRDRAAAVAIAIWLRHPGTGADSFHANNRFLIAAIPDALVRSRIVSDAISLSAQMDAYSYASPVPAGEVSVLPSNEDALRGEIELTGLPSGAIGTLRISGAFFGDTTQYEVPVTGNGRLPYRLAPDDNDMGSAMVEATLDVTLPGGVPGPAIRVWHSAPSMQDAGAAGPVQNDFSWTLRGNAEHSLVFSPTLTTLVPSRVLAAGDALADTFTLSLIADGVPWRKFTDGSSLPLTVVCHAYGPFATPQAEVAEVPRDAPLATEPVRVRVGGGDVDPLLETYDVVYALVPNGGGYYTSVCGIDAADQDDPRSVQGLPAGYRFADAFGLAEETQFSPVGIRFDTTLSDSQVHPGAEVVDVIVGEATGGPWAQWEGAPLRVALVGNVYWSATRPAQSTLPPEGANSVATLHAELTDARRRTEALIQLPDRPGWYTVRWCTDPAAVTSDEGAPLVRLWCDDYGIPSETVHAVDPVPLSLTAAAGGVGTLATTGSGPEAISLWMMWLLVGAGLGSLAASAAWRRRHERRSTERPRAKSLRSPRAQI